MSVQTIAEVAIYKWGLKTIVSTSQNMQGAWTTGHLVEVFGPELSDEELIAIIKREMARSRALPGLQWPRKREDWKPLLDPLWQAAGVKSEKAFAKRIERFAILSLLATGQLQTSHLLDNRIEAMEDLEPTRFDDESLLQEIRIIRRNANPA